MDEAQERQIALGLRQGKADAWQALYDAYAERVWRVVARSLGANATAVADVVQETFMAAARSAATYDPSRGSLWWWLWGIARRHVALHYRVAARHERWKTTEAGSTNGVLRHYLERSEPSPVSAVEAAELAQLVRAALTELSPEYEWILAARYLDGDTVEHIAEQERSTAIAIRSKLARARQAFREILKKYAVFSEEQT